MISAPAGLVIIQTDRRQFIISGAIQPHIGLGLCRFPFLLQYLATPAEIGFDYCNQLFEQLYMPDYKNEPEGIEELMPWSDMIQQRCRIKSKS